MRTLVSVHTLIWSDGQSESLCGHRGEEQAVTLPGHGGYHGEEQAVTLPG